MEPAFAIVRARWIFFGALEWHVTGAPSPDGRRVQMVLDVNTGEVRAARQF